MVLGGNTYENCLIIAGIFNLQRGECMGVIDINNIPKGDGSGANIPGLQDSAIFENNGTVGIGTSAPGDQLEVQKGAIRITPDSTQAGRLTILPTGAGNWWNLANTNDGSKLMISLGNKTAADDSSDWNDGLITVQDDGKVGIGATVPQAALHVNGDFIAKGPMTDVRSYGALLSPPTTGSVLATSPTTLTVANPLGFNLGDGILIAGAMSGGEDLQTSIQTINANNFTIADSSNPITNALVTHYNTGTISEDTVDDTFTILTLQYPLANPWPGQALWIAGAGPATWPYNGDLLTTVAEVQSPLVIKIANDALKAYPNSARVYFDDWAAIQATLNAWSGPAFLPQGTYYIFRPLTISDHQSIVGCGINSVLDGRYLQPGTAVLQSNQPPVAGAGASTISCILLANFKVAGGDINTIKSIPAWKANITGIFMKGIASSQIENIWVEFCRIGLRIRGWGQPLFNCHADNCLKGIDVSWYSDNDPWHLNSSLDTDSNDADNNVQLNSCSVWGGPSQFTLESIKYDGEILTITCDNHNYAVGDEIYIWGSTFVGYDSGLLDGLFAVTGVVSSSVFEITQTGLIFATGVPINAGGVTTLQQFIANVSPQWPIAFAQGNYDSLNSRYIITYSTGTQSTPGSHGFNNGDVAVITGCANTNFNGTFARIYVLSTTQFQVMTNGNPGTWQNGGTPLAFLPQIGLYVDGDQNCITNGVYEKQRDPAYYLPMLDYMPTYGIYIKSSFCMNVNTNSSSPTTIQGIYSENQLKTFVFDGCSGVTVMSCFCTTMENDDIFLFLNGADFQGNTFINNSYMSAYSNGQSQINFGLGSMGIGTQTPSSLLEVAQPNGGPGFVSVLQGQVTDPTQVFGWGTQFTNTFKQGDSITIGGEQNTVSAIADDFNLTVSNGFSSAYYRQPYLVSGGPRLAVKGFGYVGIGTTTPGEKLEVQGGAI